MRTALVVDDDPAILELVPALLVSAGFEVWSAGGVAEALQSARATPHLDLLVCDVQLGEEDGIALTLRVKDWHPHAQVVVISSSTLRPRELQKVRAIGRFLPKDIDLLSALHDAVSDNEPRPPGGE